MAHIPTLIQDLALILGSAGIVSLLFKWLKQPVVLGYILAGCLVGPHFSTLPTVQEAANITIWAEIGVIFLLFGLGLEFSFKKLAKVGPSASITAVVEVVSMLGIGYLAGQWLGWSSLDSLFLGGILSISSTTIIIRAFDELGLKSRKFVSLVFGSLIIEDLVAILLLVLLSTLSVSQKFQGAALLSETAKLGFFLILWFVTGIFLLPTFLKRVRRFMNDETLLIVSLALCLAMVILASKVGFSPALGAFIMGSLLAETTEAEKIEHLTKPVKDLFSSIFFVSVGMLIDPKILVEQVGPVALITFLTIFGKSISSTIGALISGQTVRHSVQTGMSLAQIGEFSFIIAALGLTLNVTSDFLYPIAVAVSAITTLTTPYMIRASDRVAGFVERKLPSKWSKAMSHYSSVMQSTSQDKAWQRFVRSRLTRVVVNSIVVIAMFGLGQRWLLPEVIAQFGPTSYAVAIYALTVLGLAGPFLWAVALGGSRALSVKELIKNARTLGPLALVEIVRFVVAFALIFSFVVRLPLMDSQISIVFLALLIVGIFFFWFKMGTVYRWFESTFLSNLNERDLADSKTVAPPILAPWDGHIAYFRVPPEASFVGQTLIELGVRERFGVSIALIQRGQKRIVVPAGTEKIYPGDNIGVIGTDEQLQNFSQFIQAHLETVVDADNKEYVLRSLRLNADSAFVGKQIRNSGLREKANGMIVGLERSGKRILNPQSDTLLQVDDLVWMVGDEMRIKEI